MEAIKKIDIHAHCTAFPQYAPLRGGLEPAMPSVETLKYHYEKINVEKAVLLPIVSPEAMHFTMTSENCKFLSDTHPDMFVWFCNVDPRALGNSSDSNLGELLEHYKSLGAKGVGELTSNLYVDDPMTENLFATAAALNMPVTIHIAPSVGGYYGIVDDLGLPRLEKMLKKYPKLTILGHSQCLWSEISENSDDIRCTYPEGPATGGRLTEILRECPNLLLDLSAGSGANAFMRDREHAARFFEEFADRMYYGCDICGKTNTFHLEFDEFLTSMRESGELSDENYRKIVRENAVKLLGL